MGNSDYKQTRLRLGLLVLATLQFKWQVSVISQFTMQAQAFLSRLDKEQF